MFESPFSNPYVNGAFCIGALFTVSVVVLPFLRPVFGTVALSPLQWGVCWVNSFLILPFVELQKAVKRKAAKRKETLRKTESVFGA